MAPTQTFASPTCSRLGDASQLIRKHRKENCILVESRILDIITHISLTLRELHKQISVHRDIKSEIVDLTSPGVAKLETDEYPTLFCIAFSTLAALPVLLKSSPDLISYDQFAHILNAILVPLPCPLLLTTYQAEALLVIMCIQELTWRRTKVVGRQIRKQLYVEFEYAKAIEKIAEFVTLNRSQLLNEHSSLALVMISKDKPPVLTASSPHRPLQPPCTCTASRPSSFVFVIASHEHAHSNKQSSLITPSFPSLEPLRISTYSFKSTLLAPLQAPRFQLASTTD
ncbi:hypothetical protein BLNAU_24463 [Blattamonas nauphoetae]|uniref:Uncharacterized protein n=1 Tax=Blattamonas nauphoetae TaxID=2049346 RepID=A0ABQ9WME7_9EUKA|nr:hypothetical protein BLNAU_24463 [Blattamonas nauphoetae]